MANSIVKGLISFIYLFTGIALSGYGRQEPQIPPNPRHLEEIAYDSERGVLQLFGGGGRVIGKGTEFPDYLSEWNRKSWTHFENPEPKNRLGHGLVYDVHEKATFLLGGVSEISQKTVLDVWKWNGKQWALVSSDCPAKTLEAAYDPIKKRILIYGDTYNKNELAQRGDPLAQELWEFKSNTWKKLSAEGPQVSTQFEIAFDSERNALVIPTWENGQSIVWEWQNGKWNKINPEGKSPDQRNRFGLAYHTKQKATFLLDGRNSTNPYLDDFWKWNGKNWTKIESIENPSMRCAISLEYGDNSLILYGGVTEWGITNEMWQWKDGIWKLLNGEYAMSEANTIRALSQWLVSHPDDAEVLLQYGSLLGRRKEYDEAITLLKKAWLINPTSHDALISLCDVLYVQGKDTEAERYIEEAVKAGKMQRHSYVRLANYYLPLKRLKVSAMCFEKAIEMESHAGDFYNLGCIYSLLNDKDKAFDALDKAIALGFNTKQQYESDADLELLKSDTRWKMMSDKLK